MGRAFHRLINFGFFSLGIFAVVAIIPNEPYADDFAFINAPAIGLVSPTEEGPGEGVYDDTDNLTAVSGGGAFALGPLFIYVAGGYGFGDGYKYESPDVNTEIGYKRAWGEATAGYRLTKGSSFSLYYCGRTSYDRAYRDRYSDGTFPDWDEGDGAYAEIRDDGTAGEFNVSGGPAVMVRDNGRFFLFGYAGLGFGRVRQTGTWKMKWYPPSTPREDKARYDETGSGVSFAGAVLSRVQVASWFGIGGGLTVTTWPAPTGYAYIPESHFRHWRWGTVNLNLWIGPSFSL